MFNYTNCYQENFLEKNLLEENLTLSLSAGNKNFGKPKVCHHTKKCSNGKAHTLIGMWWWYLPQTSAH